MRVGFKFDVDKAREAVLYLASRAEVTDLDKYKAAKLLFLADKYHLVRFARPILGDSYRALPFGPIPQGTLDILHLLLAGYTDDVRVRRLAAVLKVDRAPRHSHPQFKAAVPASFDSLSRSDVMALDHVVALHGKKSFNELAKLTHDMAAYRLAWERRGGMRAADMRYEEFFEDDADAVEGALEEMIEDSQLREAFPGPVEL